MLVVETYLINPPETGRAEKNLHVPEWIVKST